LNTGLVYRSQVTGKNTSTVIPKSMAEAG